MTPLATKSSMTLTLGPRRLKMASSRWSSSVAVTWASLGRCRRDGAGDEADGDELGGQGPGRRASAGCGHDQRREEQHQGLRRARAQAAVAGDLLAITTSRRKAAIAAHPPEGVRQKAEPGGRGSRGSERAESKPLLVLLDQSGRRYSLTATRPGTIKRWRPPRGRRRRSPLPGGRLVA